MEESSKGSGKSEAGITEAGANLADAGERVPASRRMTDVPLASLDTFMKAWRAKCPWLAICNSVSMSTRCNVCEHLRSLIDQTSPSQDAMRSALQARLGEHHEFQAAQRMAHGLVEETRSQSGGERVVHDD